MTDGKTKALRVRIPRAVKAARAVSSPSEAARWFKELKSVHDIVAKTAASHKVAMSDNYADCFVGCPDTKTLEQWSINIKTETGWPCSFNHIEQFNDDTKLAWVSGGQSLISHPALSVVRVMTDTNHIITILLDNSSKIMYWFDPSGEGHARSFSYYWVKSSWFIKTFPKWNVHLVCYTGLHNGLYCRAWGYWFLEHWFAGTLTLHLQSLHKLTAAQLQYYIQNYVYQKCIAAL